MGNNSKIDHDLAVLRETKSLLSKTVEKRKQRINELINNPRPALKSWKDMVNNNASSGKKSKLYDLKLLEKLLDIESHDIVKIGDDKYSVTISMSNLTLAIEFSVDKTIAENNENYEITSLSAKVSDIEDWFVRELQPCIIYCEENKDLQLLMFNISQYQRKHDERCIITNNLARSKLLNLKYDSEGTTFSISNTKKPRTVFCKVTWSLHFSRHSLSFVHRFIFEDGDKEGFVEENKELLLDFNVPSNLATLKTNWNNLYSLICQTKQLSC